MLSRVEVTNASGSTLVLPLTNEDTGYIVRNIDGLGPVKATIASSTYANFDGAQFQSSRREIRNITMILGMEPDFYDETVESLRQKLYSYFSPKSLITLRFHLGTGIDYETQGYVESMETLNFAQNPLITISILCMDPDFIDAVTTTISGESTSTTTENDVVYSGTSDTGMIFTLSPTRNINGFVLYVRSPDGMLRQLSYEVPLLAGDIVTVNTNLGSKAVTLLRASVESSLLYALPTDVSWVRFYPGTNTVRVYIAGGPPIPYTISYRNRYGGI